MDTPPTTQALTAQRNRLPVTWMTIAVFAIVISYVDGFWVTSLHGAVGAVSNSQSPFSRWLRDSTMMLPLFCLGVLAALALTHRWLGKKRGELVKLAAATLLIVVITSALSVAEVATTSATDYKIQASEIGQIHSNHVSTPAADPGTVVVSNPGACKGLCAARHATLMAHVRAVEYSSVVLLITNLVLVVWLLALRGGRLWARHGAPIARINEPSSQVAVGAALV